MRQGAFLAAYAQLARVNKAADAAGVDRRTHYDWLREDGDYREEFERAKELAVQQLEDEAVRRAVEGVEEPMNIGGEMIMVRKFSDPLLMFILKGQKPTVYRERQSIEHTGKDGSPLIDLSAVHEFLRRTADK